MYVKIPFESTIDFKSNIFEITKMSLEHDFNVSDGLVLGNFYVSGEYRSHEVSVNTETFKHTLPFTVSLREDIKKDTLEFNIEDFSYEILDKTKLKVNIEYSLTAEVEEELFERVNENELNSELEFIDDFLNQEQIKDNKKEEKDERIDEEVQDETSKDIKENKEVEERLDEGDTVINTIKDSTDTFVTYHIHIVKESETLESISKLYDVPSSIITEYNNLDSVSIGDKVLIPKIDE